MSFPTEAFLWWANIGCLLFFGYSVKAISETFKNKVYFVMKPIILQNYILVIKTDF